jgi:4-methylaminobutanoate oxidase (formaldehyde-forming)
VYTKSYWRQESRFNSDTPLEAGLGFAVKFDKAGGFIGREALLDQKENGLMRRLVQFCLDDPQPLLYHNEPIWREDTIVGHVTSGAYGHTLGSCIGLGYVAGAIQGEKIEVEVAGERFAAEASISPLYDPDNARIRC